MSNTAVQPHQPLRARVALLTGLLNRWLDIDTWVDSLVAPADLVHETREAVKGRVGLRELLPGITPELLADARRRIGYLRVDDGSAVTVLDFVNGLEWQAQDDGVKRDWASAKAYCEQLRLGGHSDWRLPTVAELNSLVDRKRREPAIDTSLFPDTKSDFYWTGEPLASRNASSPSVYAWVVYFGSGVVDYNLQGLSGFVRAVRRVSAGQ